MVDDWSDYSRQRRLYHEVRTDDRLSSSGKPFITPSRQRGAFMHMLLVICGGIVLLGVFALFGKLWGGDAAGIATGMKFFIPVWLMISLTNMWVGVAKAGYTVAQELPVLLIVIAVPAALMSILVWQLTRS